MNLEGDEGYYVVGFTCGLPFNSEANAVNLASFAGLSAICTVTVLWG